jgi:hypothetical protein
MAHGHTMPIHATFEASPSHCVRPIVWPPKASPIDTLYYNIDITIGTVLWPAKLLSSAQTIRSEVLSSRRRRKWEPLLLARLVS